MFPDHLVQYVATLCASLGGMFVGSTMSFTAPVGPLLSDQNATIHLSEGQISIFTSSLNLGGMVGSLCCGPLMSSFGRRGSMLIFGFPAIIGWIVMAFSKNFTMLLIARILTGIGCGISTGVVPAYIGEISSPEIRGRLGSSFTVMLSLGLIYVSVVGALIKDIFAISLICCLIPVLMVCTLPFLPESPVFLMSRKRTEDAEIALRKLNGSQIDISIQMESMAEMAKSTSETHEGIVTKLMKLKSLSGLKPLFIIVALFFFLQFGGINAFIFNINFIFQAAGSTLSPDISGIIVVSFELVGAILSGMLIEKTGRRNLLMASSITNFLATGLFGCFSFLNEIKDDWSSWTLGILSWLSLLCLCVYILGFSLGIGNVAFVLRGELFQSELQEISGSISSFAFWMFSFLVTLTYFPLKNILEEYGSFWLYSSISFACVFFTYFCVPETKGKTTAEIMSIYLKNS